MRHVTLVVSAVGTEARSSIGTADSLKRITDSTLEEGTIRLEAVVSDDRACEIVDTVLGSDANTAAFERTLETLVEREMESSEMHGKLFERLISAFERILIGRVYESCQGVQTRAAEYLGIDRNTLHKKLCKYKLLLATRKIEPFEAEPETIT